MPAAIEPSGRSCVIRAHDVHKSYRLGSRTVQALRGVSLEITAPQFCAIMGPSGSGKSTLLHLLAGLDKADDGSIEVAGRRLDDGTERDLTLYRRRDIGIVFQQFNLISTLTAAENIALPGVLDGMPAAQRTARVQELIDLLGLTGREHHRPDAMSGGEQQRVAIARALLFNPAVLFADEPTGNLDTATSEEVWNLLERLAADQHMTVLMVTHEPSAAVHSRRVFVLRDGLIQDVFETEHLDAAELATRAQQSRR
jgi:putative ABC transport system ATP-binding protein